MPIPRVRLRALMIAIAVAATVLAVVVMREKSARFRRRATYHAEAERSYRTILDHHLEVIFTSERSSRPERRPGPVQAPGIHLVLPALEAPDPLTLDRDCATRYGAAVVYHSAMREKYEGAAWRPWRSVEPDPPAPE